MNHANDPNDPYEKVTKIIFWIVVAYFVIVFIPQVLNKLL